MNIFRAGMGCSDTLSPVQDGLVAKKKTRSRQSGTAWTRSGCLTCKKRRKGCDKAKPSCNNCIKQGRICEGYGSLWVEPLGPSAEVFKPGEDLKRQCISASSTPHFITTSPSLSPSSEWRIESPSTPESTMPTLLLLPSPADRSVEEPMDRNIKNEIRKLDEKNELQAQKLALIPRSKSFTSHLSVHESHYLQYHFEYGSQRLANLESEDNPLRSLLIPRAISSSLLMKALCAISALHFANRTQGTDAKAAAASFYGRTLSGLRIALAECPTDILPEDSMLAVGLLCKYEIVRGSVKQWAIHLNALQSMIASRGGLASMDRDTGFFLRGLYIYANNMGRISNRKRITSVDMSTANTDFGPPRLDIYHGYTEEIIELCSRIAELPSLEGDAISLRLAIVSINEALLNWSHTSKSYIIPQGLPQKSLIRLQLVAECFRDAAFIYLHSILERMSIHSESLAEPGIDLFSTEWAPLISISTSSAVHSCLSRVKSFPLDDHCEYSALTFPLFICGCESDVLEYRDSVVHFLSKLQYNFAIGNVERAKELLTILWARRDAHELAQQAGFGPIPKVHWLDVVEELQWDLILA
ncbi:hypothetical protein N7495_002840 [Penicillium taxi]|uniref:uncharacterized protein n=1 Tax=Penicillium taxi TaxID=168475 RepID=UPI002544DB38|nr:uncharacterized protein N7495_002840 [Penicillium taxi]KAJ5902312.1 hypothetical protein N7495_002840 [Penicillium taxi]